MKVRIERTDEYTKQQRIATGQNVPAIIEIEIDPADLSLAAREILSPKSGSTDRSRSTDAHDWRTETMKPNAETHNPDPGYLARVVTRTGLKQSRISEIIGVPTRTLSRYINTPGTCPYPVQFALESLAEGPRIHLA